MTGTCPLCGSAVGTDAFRVDLASNTLLAGGQVRKLRGTVAEIFTVLAKYSPCSVRREALYRAVYGLRLDAPEPKTIDVHICLGRKALAGTGWKIETVWGRGWRLVKE